MRGFKSIFVSSKHKINCFLIQEKYFQTANAVDTLPLKTLHKAFLSIEEFAARFTPAAAVTSATSDLKVGPPLAGDVA